MGKAFLLASYFHLHFECFNGHIFKFYIDETLDVLLSLFLSALTFSSPTFLPFLLRTLCEKKISHVCKL